MAPRKIERKETQFERQMAYSKRSKGLLKKVFELSVLCDVDVALIMYAPNGRLRHFSNKKPERILKEYIQHQATIPENNAGELNNSVKPVISEDTIDKINMFAGQVEEADQHRLETNEKEINEETKKLILLQELHKKLFPDIGTSISIEDLEERKRFLVEALHKIQQKKRAMLSTFNIGTYDAHSSQPSLLLQIGEQLQQVYQNEIETPFVAQPQEMQQFDVPLPLPEMFEISKDPLSLDDIVNTNMSQKTPPDYLENIARWLYTD